MERIFNPTVEHNYRKHEWKLNLSINLRLEYLNELGVFKWEIWKKEVSKFPWTYDSQKTCYFLEGDVVVTPDGGQPVQMGKGDLVRAC